MRTIARLAVGCLAVLATTSGLVCAGTCGDGILDPAEGCDLGAAQNNDVDSCCTSFCDVHAYIPFTDVDGDGICDALDPCVTGVPVTTAKAKLVDGGNYRYDRVAYSAEFVFGAAAAAALHPQDTGAVLLLRDVFGRNVWVGALPPGPYQSATHTGWRVSSSGTSWKFVGNPGTGIGTVNFGVRTIGSPVRDRVRVTARSSHTGAAIWRLPPMGAAVVLDGTAGPSALCGKMAFPVGTCLLQGPGVTCRLP